MTLLDFDYDLPDASIARRPCVPRDASRLMVVHRSTQSFEHRIFRELPEILRAGDLLVANASKVFAARFFARKRDTGGRVELLLVEPVSDDATRWRALVGASKAVRAGARLVLVDAPAIEITVVREEGDGFVVVDLPVDAYELAGHHGSIPLPPYLAREADDADVDAYQTVYARELGSVAAPTAGLHFTPDLLSKLDACGVGFASVTLHVGPGTFLPIRTDAIEEHVLHEEHYVVDEACARAVDHTRRLGGRVVAVGTTSTRVLESEGRPLFAHRGSTRIFIRPGHPFRSVDALITNFHLPRSTLVMLVAAFGGTELVMSAYREAVARGYRFYSYGDAMLIL